METPFLWYPFLASKMSSTISLNTRVHIVSRSGNKEIITARELIARGTGSSFEAFQMLDEYEGLTKAYDAEQRAISNKKDREDHLPLGAHLLPADYQVFLYTWNKTISQNQGWWNGEDRAVFWKANPELKAQFMREHKFFRERYLAEIQAVKDYQATHSVEDNEDEVNVLPSLPPSPVPAQELAEQPDTDCEDDQMQSENQEPKRSHNPIYINYKWPSPIAKVFVQHIRGNNAWNYHCGKYRGAWQPFEFRCRWKNAGNTEFKLTHDNCMRYLAYKMGSIPLSKLLEMEPRDVHAKLIGEFNGVRGFFTKRYGYYGY